MVKVPDTPMLIVADPFSSYTSMDALDSMTKAISAEFENRPAIDGVHLSEIGDDFAFQIVSSLALEKNIFVIAELHNILKMKENNILDNRFILGCWAKYDTDIHYFDLAFRISSYFGISCAPTISCYKHLLEINSLREKYPDVNVPFYDIGTFTAASERSNACPPILKLDLQKILMEINSPFICSGGIRPKFHAAEGNSFENALTIPDAYKLTNSQYLIGAMFGSPISKNKSPEKAAIETRKELNEVHRSMHSLPSQQSYS